MIDDGTAEAGVDALILQEHVFYNRFTTPEFPVELVRAEVVFQADPSPASNVIAVLRDEDGSISNGAELVGSVAVSLSKGTNTVEFDPPLLIGEPGFILLGLHPRLDASLDLDGVGEIASFWCTYDPGDWTFGDSCINAGPIVLLSTDEPANLMLRAFGVVSDVPVELQAVTVD